MENQEAVIRELVELHGEGGVCPTAAEWRAILSRPADRALELLNLLAFVEEVETDDGPASGADAYRAYTEAAAPAFERAGATLLHLAPVEQGFGTPPDQEWDMVVLTRYPTPRSVADFWLDEEFVAAHRHRADGVARSLVLVLGRGAPA